MQKDSLNNVHIQSEKVLLTPEELKAKVPVSEETLAFIADARRQISDIVHHKDHRLLVICGPCSIHDMEAAKDYATRLKALHDKYSDSHLS